MISDLINRPYQRAEEAALVDGDNKEVVKENRSGRRWTRTGGKRRGFVDGHNPTLEAAENGIGMLETGCARQTWRILGTSTINVGHADAYSGR
jgi:hypothetical protein